MLKEKTIATETIYQGKIISVRRDQVLLPNGKPGYREVVGLADAVAIVAVTEKLEVIMVKQYRYPVARELLEIPAGKMEADEHPLDCAKRELEEETGYRALNWRQLGAFLTSPGFCTEIITFFMASGLTLHQTKLDPDEFVKISKVPLQDALELIHGGHILDAKTIIGLLTLDRIHKDNHVVNDG